MTPKEAYIETLYATNVAIYGDKAARFIRLTAITYCRTKIIIDGCELSPKGQAAARQVSELAADYSAHLSQFLEIPPDALLSYLELGKKMAKDFVNFLKEEENVQ